MQEVLTETVGGSPDAQDQLLVEELTVKNRYLCQTILMTVLAGLIVLTIPKHVSAQDFGKPQYADTTGKIVSYGSIKRGTIIINTRKRRLYYGVGNGKAIRYSVGVGRRGRQWTGTRRIVSKRRKPAWSPTKEILRDKPNITKVIPGGSPKNPMGAAALLLSGRVVSDKTKKSLIGEAQGFFKLSRPAATHSKRQCGCA